MILRKNYVIVNLYDDSGIMPFTKRGIEEHMKRRIVACILALTMLMTDIIPVAAGGDDWRTSSFQKTIDWLFGHSDEIGYADISAVAAGMKQDYSLLQGSLSDDGLREELIHILDSYVRARAENSAGAGSLWNAAVGNGHRKLWEYFRGNVRPYSGSVLEVQPKLQVRDVKETEKEIILSVYEWVYMTYEINGRKDISAHGFEHQMVFRAGEEAWTLVQDQWDTGEGESIAPKEPVPDAEEDTELSKDQENADTEADGNIVSGGNGSAEDGQFSGSGSIPDGGGAPEPDASPDGGGTSQPDISPDDDGIPEPDESQGNGNLTDSDTSRDDDGAADGSGTQEGDAPADKEASDGKDDTAGNDDGQGNVPDGNEDKAPGTDTDGDETAVPDDDGNAAGGDVPVQDDIPADADGTKDKEQPDDPADDMAAGDPEEDSSTYKDGLTENAAADPENAAIFSEMEKWEKPESEGLFISVQEMMRTYLTPLTSMFSLRTLNYTYSYKDAVAYADKYAMSYNPAYPNYNSIGGDCANFVSQCLYAGGLPMTDGWFYRDGSRSGSWSLANGLFTYVSENCGTAVIDPDIEDVTAGNPVFYYSASKGRYSHAAICVGVNASGVPVVDAHNNDHLRAVWTLGSNWARRAVVKINGNASTAGTEAPSLPPEELGDGELWQITASSLNLRKGAGTSYAVVGTIPASKVIRVTEKTDVSGKTWGKTTYNGVTGWCSLSYASYVSGSIDGGQVTGITLNRSSATISGLGNTLKLTATVTPAGTASGCVWTSNNFGVATVDADGLVRAVGDGTAVITVQTTDGSDKTASCIVSVADRPITAIKMSQSTLTFSKPGSTAQLSVSYTPSAPSSPGVAWKSSNADVVSVDAGGKVTALKNGTATITATAQDGFSASASCKIVVGKFTVKYYLNGGKNNKKNKSYYYSGDGMQLYNPTRSGYVFGGWYKKKNLTGKISKIAAGKTTNFTLYAKWVKLAKPTIRKLQRKGSGQIKVYMAKKIAGASGFEIQCATNTKFTKGVKKLKTTAQNKTVTGLKKGKRYYVRVRPYIKIASGNYVYGSYSGYRYTTVSK